METAEEGLGINGTDDRSLGSSVLHEKMMVTTMSVVAHLVRKDWFITIGLSQAANLIHRRFRYS